MLGMPVGDTWGDAGPLLEEKMRIMSLEQRRTEEDEWRFFVERESEIEGGTKWLEEIFLKFSIIPIIDNSEVLGFTHAVAETTSVRLWERRMKVLVDLGEVLVTARDVRSYWKNALQQLATIEPYYDIPMAILYSVEDDTDFAMTTTGQLDLAKICRLAGTLAVPEKHPAVPLTINLGTDQDALARLFRKSLAVAHPLLLQTSDGTLPQTLLEGIEWRDCNGDPCRSAVMCPIRPTKEENVMGFLLLGLNPRRPYDNDYRQYIYLLAQKFTTSLASVVLLEEEARRRRNAVEQAAHDQAMLKERLEVQTKEANESLQLLEAVAEFVPVGMCFNDPQGKITYANDAWYKITGCPPGAGPIANEGFLTRVKEEDRGIISTAYEKLTTEKSSYTEFEFRVKKQADLPLIRTSPSFEKAGLDLVSVDELTERYVLAIAQAERARDGTIIRILTCLTDVTVHKRTAEEAVRRAQQAENLKRMAEFATVGMYDMDLEGRLLGANNVFFEMCGLEKVDLAKVNIKPWELSVVEEDHSLLTEKIAKMVAEDKVQNVEVRLKTEWAAEDGKLTLPRWVQATLMPVRSTEGVIQSFTGCLSDVSLQKWQLEREKERKEEAIESKRQQENFIDMTSHEMRNPLSAIIHCADAITAALNKVQAFIGGSQRGLGEILAGNTQNDHWNTEVRDCLESSIDSAETIVGCAQHQKRIVDDILTMSKLDSKLLTIAPITVNPIIMVQEALKMFELEARRVDIDLSMVVDQSYRDLQINLLDFDPSRLKQVLINLLTNALKFTKTGPTRNVSVAIGASLSRPTEATSKVQFIPRTETDSDEEYDYSNNNRRDPVFVMFEVQDTGQGLSDEEMKSLFQRFVQASSRTHIKYGGRYVDYSVKYSLHVALANFPQSGLGLFISRMLTELQGGQIGVASQPGVGSTFAFYIEAHIPSEEFIQEAETSAVAAKAASFATLRTGATDTLNKRTSSNGSAATPTSVSHHNTLAATPISEISSSSSMLPLVASPSLPSQIRGVLVVEDNVINQRITQRGLVEMGFNVDIANHGVECLHKLRLTDRYIAKPEDEDDDGDESEGGGMPITPYSTSAPVDSTPQPKFPLSVILMDIEMPIQDGLTCTRNIRELEKSGRIAGGRIPIIAVSANARLEQIMEAKEAGCDDVLAKPYRMPALLEIMQTVMARIAEETDQH